MNLKKKFFKIRSSTSFASLLLTLTQSIIALFFILFDFLFSKKLSVVEFGYWKEMFFLLNLGIPLLSFGIPEGYKYYLAKEGKHKVMFSNTLMSFIIIGFFLSIFFVLVNVLHFFHWISLDKYYLISLLFPLSYLVFNINKTLRYGYINEKKVLKHTKITLLFYVVTLVLTLVFYLNIDKIKSQFLYVGLLFFIALYGFPLYSLIRTNNLVLKPKWLNKDFLSKVFKQGLPLYLATFIGTISVNLDKSIVSFFEDKATFAIFSVGALEIPIFAMLSAAFSQNIYPSLVKLVSNNKKEEAKELWLDTTKKVSYITFPILLVLMIFSKEIIFFIYTTDYSESVIIFQTYLLIGLFRNNYYGALIAASGQTKFITLYSAMMLILNLILSIILYYIWGINGIVFASLFATIIIALLQLKHEKLLKKYLNDFLFDYRIIIMIILILFFYFKQIL